MADDDVRTVVRTCPLCEAVCGLTLTLDSADRVLSVRGDKDDPFSKGFICPKGASLGRLNDDPDRLTAPMVRDGATWRTVSWDEAFARVAEGLAAVTAEHGRASTAVYLGNPNAHTVGGLLYAPLLIRALRTKQVYSASTADQMPKQVSAGLMFGDPLAVPVPDLDRTDYLLMLGANPAESNGSLCTAPDFPGRLKALRRRGGRLVVVDPRRTRTAGLADEHVFVRPGSDAYLLFGIVRTLFAQNLVRVAVAVEGLDAVREAAEPFTPEVVAARTGVSAETVVRLAQELAEAPTAAVYARIGTCTAEFGTVTQWLVDVINVLTGNLDRPGGAMFARSAAQLPRRTKPFTTGRWTSRVRGLPETMGEIPVATLVDEITTPGDGQVRALVTIAGNPLLSSPGGDRLDAALAGLDFMVSVDCYLNETTRHATVILPPPRVTQSPHYDFALLQFAVRNYTRYSPAVAPLNGQLSEAEILARLAMIAAGQQGDPSMADELVIMQTLHQAVRTAGSAVVEQDPAALRAKLQGNTSTEQRIDMMLKLGPWGEWSGGKLSLQTLLDNPHGIDLGPLEPQLPDRLITASGKVELAPPQLLADVARLTAGLAEPVPEMVLIGRRHLRSNNSWMHNVPTLVGGSNTCTLQINPADVARFALDGRAVVTSAVGRLEVPLEVTDSIMPGVVSLPHGWGHGGDERAVAGAHAGVNANTLTDPSVLDVPSGNAVFNGVPVTVSST